MSEQRQYVTFFVDDLYCGVEIEHVQEILRYQELTIVPLAPDIVRGLVNLRGQVVTAVDLRRRFGLDDASADAAPMNVIVRTPDGPVSFLVDQIDDVVEADGAAFERSPETVNAVGRELLAGVYKLDRRLLLALDIERVARVHPN